MTTLSNYKSQVGIYEHVKQLAWYYINVFTSVGCFNLQPC